MPASSVPASPVFISPPAMGDLVDLAPFAQTRAWSGTERQELWLHDLWPHSDGHFRPWQDESTGLWQIGLEWPEAQHVCAVEAHFATDSAADGDLPTETPTGRPTEIWVEYWHKYWPMPAVERRPGAHSGWIYTDDPWNGAWSRVKAARTIEGTRTTFLFDPLDLAEIRNARQLAESADYLAPFRSTLKVRLLWRSDHLLPVQRLRAFSQGQWQAMKVALHFGDAGDWQGHAEVTHGYLLSAPVWQQPQPNDAIPLDLLVARGEPTVGTTVVTIHCAERSFSFAPQDLEHGPISIPDFGVTITSGESVTSPSIKPSAPTPPIYARIAQEDEQSLARALSDMPLMDVTKQDSLKPGLGRYVVLGIEAGRQEFGLRYNGEIFMSKPFLKPTGRDLARLMWPGLELRYRFGTGDAPDFREDRADATQQSRQEGYLPIFTSRWLDREIEWKQTAFATVVEGPLTDYSQRRGDEDTVSMVRVLMRNSTPGKKRAQLWLAVDPQEAWELRDGMILATGRVVPDVPVARQWRVDRYPTPYLRATLTPGTSGKGQWSALPFNEGEGSRAIPTALLYTVELEDDEEDTVDLTIPFVSYDKADEWAKVAALRWEVEAEDVAAYWRAYVEQGGQLILPDSLLTEFYKAVRVHVAISADKDPVNGLSVLPPGTFTYGACANEACWQIGMLDEAGYHERAAYYLETFLQTQGAAKLDGNFQSAEGALQGLDLDDGQPLWSAHVFGYNLDHGYIMECLARHYRLTGDEAWLRRVAPHLVAACELVIRERQATKQYQANGDPVIEWGLMPAGHLEDNPEWRHWFSVNAHAHGGMQAIAAILAEIDHPDAARLKVEAEAYREDIRQSARRAMINAPVTRLLDGSYIPRIPTRTALRGRDWGWFREIAYGALHLMDGNVFAPWEEEMTWTLIDLEDSFISRDWGRPIDRTHYWFSQGGVTVQSNLLDNGIAYLRRQQPEHALRALFNNFATQIFPDLRLFSEHAVTELGTGIGPFYKSSDEAKFVQWLRAYLIYEEQVGDQESRGEATLHLAPVVPRAWLAPGGSFGVREMATYFGALTYLIEAEEAQVIMTVEVPSRRPLQKLVVHLRRPDARLPIEVLVNSVPMAESCIEGEVLTLTQPTGRLEIVARYA